MESPNPTRAPEKRRAAIAIQFHNSQMRASAQLAATAPLSLSTPSSPSGSLHTHAFEVRELARHGDRPAPGLEPFHGPKAISLAHCVERPFAAVHRGDVHPANERGRKNLQRGQASNQ